MSKNVPLRYMKFLSLVFIFLLGFSSITPAQQSDKDKEKKLPPAHYVRSRDYDIKHIALDLRFDWDKEQTFGTATITLAPLVPNFKTINLDAGLMIINSVKSSGKDLTFNYNEKETLLRVNLDRDYKIGELLTLVVDYRTKGETVPNTLGFGGGGGLKFVKPTADNPTKRKQIWSQGETDYNRYWFPSYDSPNDFRTSELRATVEKPLMVISNGQLLETKDNGDNTRTYHWKMDTPHANYLTSIVVGEYAEVKGEYAGIPVSSYVFPNELKEGEATTKRLPQMVKFFSEKTGVKYPYVKYAQTMATEFNGGMENISATTMTPNMIHDERELLDNDSDSLQSHELAHQWFGDYVTTREWGHIWLNESFATYFEALWMEESKGHDYFLYSDVRANQQAYLNAWKQGNRRPIVTKYYTDKDAIFDVYAYPRGGAVLHMLRKHLGDELFFKALNHYLVSNANKPVQTEQLRIAIEEATGQSMDWFFDQWLYKMGHPVFEVAQNYDEAKKQLTLNVKQTQKIDPKNEYPQVEFFQTYVDVEIDNKIERVWIEPKAENTFTFAAAAKPMLVNFDYEGTLIKELKFDKSVDELIYQMTNDKDILGRRWTMGELASRRDAKDTAEAEKSKILTALIQAITSEPFWAIRRDAINALLPKASQNPFEALNPNPPKYQIDEAVVKALMIAAKDKNSNVRAAAFNGLGMLRDEKMADVFINALSDRSYSVIDAAANALAMTKNAKAYGALSKLLNENSWKDRIRIAGLSGLAALGDKRAFDAGLKYADKSYPSNVRTNALNLVAATGKGDARAFSLIFENYKKALENNEFQSLIGGLVSFARLADPRGQAAFDMAKEKFKDRQNLLGFINQIEAQFKKAIEQK
ncbi:MAG: HEAT repeat domain-containing protein [Acidobacteria bacterium]|nr:HEAT repeat domain-containing protein [Acidobacteriota bacterium]